MFSKSVEEEVAAVKVALARVVGFDGVAYFEVLHQVFEKNGTMLYGLLAGLTEQFGFCIEPWVFEDRPGHELSGHATIQIVAKNEFEVRIISESNEGWAFGAHRCFKVGESQDSVFEWMKRP